MRLSGRVIFNLKYNRNSEQKISVHRTLGNNKLFYYNFSKKFIYFYSIFTFSDTNITFIYSNSSCI